jgi:cytochrome c553
MGGGDPRQPRHRVPVPWRLAALALASVAAASPSRAALADPGDPAAGEQKSRSELCQECHGEDGNSTSLATPKLAGLAPGYLAKQLRDFQSGARVHEVMTVMAAGLSEADRLDIAAYFSRTPRAKEPGGRSSPRGRELYLHGDVELGVPQCAPCHGERGEGSATGGRLVPALAAQHGTYLRIQLVKWRLGERRNSEAGVMNGVAHSLGDDDVGALADYLSGL